MTTRQHAAFQIAVAAAILLALLLLSATAHAQVTVRCRLPWQPAFMRYYDHETQTWRVVGTCIYIWRGD